MSRPVAELHADLHAAGLLPEVADVLLAVRGELRADVLDVVGRHIRAQAEHLRAAQARNRGEGQRNRDKHRWKLEALTALDQDLRQRWGANPNPEKP